MANTSLALEAAPAVDAGPDTPAPSGLIGRAVWICKTSYRGVLLALAVAAAARFFADHYSAPAMLFALLFGIAFNFLSTDERCAPGIEFASKTLLRTGVALLGFRLSLSEIASLGAGSVVAVAGLLVATIAFGILFAPLVGRHWRFGLLTGGAVAICGASAALAISAVLPRRTELEKDTLFTVMAVTTLSTIAMITYPIVTALLGFDDAQTGFLIGATIHDVAQVVGAGYAVSDVAGNLATLVKLERVAMLPIVLLAITLVIGKGEGKRVGLPLFLIGFVVCVLLNSTGLVPAVVQSNASTLSTWLLTVAIAALGIRTSLKAMVDLGPRHLILVVAETLFLLGAAIAVVHFAL
ncbi:putative sulfate exporter family transporter [Amaricoccus sp.]|uniref:YeiH family protein n=1 Tax=Amaricoccus sp. TaxID=1872485 RepID=UPI00260C6708|nr:putative sulfate exporter family transporter [Amaricoccus sp.]HRO09924.1 putative sulfate exporter family transporter [Amaricoccus sp.]